MVGPGVHLHMYMQTFSTHRSQISESLSPASAPFLRNHSLRCLQCVETNLTEFLVLVAEHIDVSTHAVNAYASFSMIDPHWVMIRVEFSESFQGNQYPVGERAACRYN